MENTNRRKGTSQKGQSMVELAISFSVLLLLLAGIIDLGRAFFTYMTMRDAAQEGAAYGSIYPADATGIISRVRDATSAPLALSSADVGVTAQVVGGGPCAGSGMQVDVYYDSFPMVMPFFGAFMGTNTIPLHAWVTDEILRPPCE
jgi:Flp pilus assembly protein TadG